MKNLLIFFFFLSNFYYSQKKSISIVSNYNLGSVNYGLYFKHDIGKENLILDIQFSYGGFGKKEYSKIGPLKDQGTPPYENYGYKLGYRLSKFSLNNIGYRFGVGLGNNWELSNKFCIEGKINLAYYFITDYQSYLYTYKWGDREDYYYEDIDKHQTYSNSFEVNLLFSLYKKTSFFIGAKETFFVPIKAGEYLPSFGNQPMFGVKPSVQIGVNFKI